MDSDNIAQELLKVARELTVAGPYVEDLKDLQKEVNSAYRLAKTSFGALMDLVNHVDTIERASSFIDSDVSREVKGLLRDVKVAEQKAKTAVVQLGEAKDLIKRKI